MPGNVIPQSILVDKPEFNRLQAQGAKRPAQNTIFLLVALRTLDNLSAFHASPCAERASRA